MAKPKPKLPDDKTRIAERLRTAREGLKLTQQQVADKAGVSRSAMVHYEKGTVTPGGGELIGLAKALKMTPNYILSGSKDFFASGSPSHALAATDIGEAELAARVSVCISVLDREVAEAISALLVELAMRKLPKKEHPAFVKALSGMSKSIAAMTPDVEKLVEAKDRQGHFDDVKGKKKGERKS